MKGLELSRKFYNEVGKPMLKERFPHLLPYIAAGLTGSGSQCYGFDDELSKDHDFSPEFMLFIPGSVNERDAFLLERAYAQLPREFMGYERPLVEAVGGNRRGVIRIEEFFKNKTGLADGKLSAYDWLSVPEYALFEAVNGEIFEDNYGLLTEIRENLSYYPDDIRLKKLAGNLLLMGQAGQYNYGRLIKRNETAAAQLAAIEFVKSAVNVLFLLNRKYVPYYKWSFRALSLCEKGSELYSSLEWLISSGNESKKPQVIESVCASIVRLLIADRLIKTESADLEQLAYTLNDGIRDAKIRNMHILSGI